MIRILITFVTAALCAGCIGPFSEMIEQEHATKAAAQAADAVGEGRWIPDILPDDAVVIREVHDIDTNETWGCFKTKEFDALRRTLSVLRAAAAQGPIDEGPQEIFRDFSWWPHVMRSTSVEVWTFHEARTAPALRGFVVRVGVDRATGTVCFHRTV